MFHFFFSNNLKLKNKNKEKKVESYKTDTNKIKLFSNNITANTNTIVARFYFQSKNNAPDGSGAQSQYKNNAPGACLISGGLGRS